MDISPQDQSFHELQQGLHAVGGRVGQAQAGLWAGRGVDQYRVDSALPVVRGGAISPECRGQLSCCNIQREARPAFPGSAKERASMTFCFFFSINFLKLYLIY